MTSVSFTVDLNTHARSFTGSTSAVAPDTLMSGTSARCTLGTRARPMSLRLPSPTITSTLSCSMRRLAASTAFVDSLPASYSVSSMRRPPMPPFLLASSTKSSTERFIRSPRKAAGPVYEKMLPILMVPA